MQGTQHKIVQVLGFSR